MARKRTVEQLLEVKSRQRHWTRTGLYYARFPELKRALAAAEDNPELLRYFPIGAVAALEGYFRAAIAEMIDSGEPYANRIERLTRDIRLDWHWARAIEGRKITCGELIAHSVPLSNLGDVQKVMDCLLDGDFLKMLRETPRDPSGARSGLNLILQDPEECFQVVVRTFELRHIFCHESAARVPISRLEMQKCVQRCLDFAFTADQMLSQVMYTGRDLSNFEMTELAARDEQGWLTKLADAEKRVLDTLADEPTRELFNDAQEKWCKYLDANVKYSVSGWEGGSGYGYAYYMARVAMIKRRVEELEGELREIQTWMEDDPLAG